MEEPILVGDLHQARPRVAPIGPTICPGSKIYNTPGFSLTWPDQMRSGTFNVKEKIEICKQGADLGCTLPARKWGTV